MHNHMEWHYANNGSQQGPVSQAELTQLVANGTLTPTSLVWKEGMADWLPYAQVPELNASAESSLNSQTPAATAPPKPTPANASPSAPVPNHLVWAILSTVLCCLPFGIVSIVYAAKVDGLVATGNIPAAQAASKNAKTWAWVSFGTGLAGILIYVGFAGIAIASEGGL